MTRASIPTTTGPRKNETIDDQLGQKMKRLAATLREQQAEAAKLDAAIAAKLKDRGYGG
jgi:type I restriction enzyme M protein